MMTSIRQKYSNWRARMRVIPPKARLNSMLKNNLFLRKHRNTRIGKWMYQRALRARAGIELDLFEVIPSVEPLVEKYEELFRQALRTKDKAQYKKIKEQVENVIMKMKRECQQKAIRRALYRINATSQEKRQVWMQMKRAEAAAQLPEAQRNDFKAFMVVAVRLDKELGTARRKRFLAQFIKTGKEAEKLLLEYLEHVSEGMSLPPAPPRKI